MAAEQQPVGWMPTKTKMIQQKRSKSRHDVGRTHLEVALHDQGELTRDVVVVERRVATEHDVQDHPDAPDVALLAIPL